MINKEQLVDVEVHYPNGDVKHFGTGALTPDPSGRWMLMYNSDGRLVNMFFPEPGTRVVCGEAVEEPLFKEERPKYEY